jgi:hypothetical protein
VRKASLHFLKVFENILGFVTTNYPITVLFFVACSEFKEIHKFLCRFSKFCDKQHVVQSKTKKSYTPLFDNYF